MERERKTGTTVSSSHMLNTFNCKYRECSMVWSSASILPDSISVKSWLLIVVAYLILSSRTQPKCQDIWSQIAADWTMDNLFSFLQVFPSVFFPSVSFLPNQFESWVVCLNVFVLFPIFRMVFCFVLFLLLFFIVSQNLTHVKINTNKHKFN